VNFWEWNPTGCCGPGFSVPLGLWIGCPLWYNMCYDPGPYFSFFLPFPSTRFMRSVTHLPLIPSHATQTNIQSPDKSPDESPDHSTVIYHMLLHCSLQYHHLTHYRLPAHDVLSIDCQLMMELYLDCQLMMNLTICDSSILWLLLPVTFYLSRTALLT